MPDSGSIPNFVDWAYYLPPDGIGTTRLNVDSMYALCVVYDDSQKALTFVDRDAVSFGQGMWAYIRQGKDVNMC